MSSNLRRLVADSEKAAKPQAKALYNFLNVQNDVEVPMDILQKMVECSGVEVAMLLDRNSFADEAFLIDAGWLQGQLWKLEQIRLRLESGEAPAKRRRCGVQHRNAMCPRHG
jgi:hypothetical protein